MVKLKNIVINGNTAKCDIYPENSKDKGTVEVNLETKDMISYTLPVGYEWCFKHAVKAYAFLIEISESGAEIPDERIIAWY